MRGPRATTEAGGDDSTPTASRAARTLSTTTKNRLGGYLVSIRETESDNLKIEID